MQITNLRISNIMGFEHLDFKPGKITTISGKNGSGKTSLVEAIKIGLNGNDASIIRNGSDKAEIVLEFDNGDVLKKVIKPSGSPTTTLKNKDGATYNSPQSRLNKLYDMMSVNPVEFITADKKKRADTLLKILTIPIEKARIESILANGIAKIILPDEMDSNDIDSVRGTVFSIRTDINRVLNDRTKAVEQLKSTMPTDIDNLEELNKEKHLIEANLNSIRDRKDKEIGKIRECSQLLIEETADFYNSQIDAIKNKMEQEIAKIKTKIDNDINEQNKLYTVDLESLNSSKSEIEQKISLANQSEGARNLISTYSAEIETYKKDSENYTAAINSLDDYKKEILSELPIRGLEIKDGEIYRDGVLYDRLNTAQQIAIAVEIAKAKAGELGVICLDGLESLDSESFEILKDGLAETNLQCFITRVSDNELEIKKEL